MISVSTLQPAGTLSGCGLHRRAHTFQHGLTEQRGPGPAAAAGTGASEGEEARKRRLLNSYISPSLSVHWNWQFWCQ